MVELSGLLVNVKSRTQTSIAVDIYSQRVDTVSNIFYQYKSGEIEAATGIPATNLDAAVNDVFRSYLISQGVENYDISINPDVIPTTVDYLVNV